MHKVKAILLSLSFFALLSVTTKANSLQEISLPKQDSTEVYLSITHNDDVVYNAVRHQLKSMSGVTIIAYCDNHALFLIKYSKESYTDNVEFLETIQKQIHEYAGLIHIKQGNGFNSFIQYCEPSDSKDISSIKKELEK